MNTSSAFFVISNFNTDPYQLVGYCDSYRIIDQSDNQDIASFLTGRNDENLSFTKNTGTSLINYLDYIIQEYENLPPLIAFLKGNVIGRHINKTEFEKRITNNWYTYLWDEKLPREVNGRNYKPQNNSFLEYNNSWYVPLSHHRYFISFDHFMEFFFQNYERSQLIDFCPGACFLVESGRITQHPRALYVALREAISYEFFPSEAWMVERSLNMIFTGDLITNSWIQNDSEARSALNSLSDKTGLYISPPGPLKAIREALRSLLTG